MKPISRSFEPTVVTVGLTTFTLCVPLSLPMRDIASIGEEVFEPFRTNTDITSGMLCERFMVTVWPEPTMGCGEYQICDPRSNPRVVVVGPAIEIQVLPKLSLGVKVTTKMGRGKQDYQVSASAVERPQSCESSRMWRLDVALNGSNESGQVLHPLLAHQEQSAHFRCR